MDTTKTETVTYNISKHCKERYAERILGKEDNNEIQRFIVENEEKIKTDLNKMVQYGDCIFIGKQSQKDGKGNVLNVYIKDTWCLLVDIKSEVIVTVYKIDLGCGDEFNLQYIDKMMEKLNKNKVKLDDAKSAVEEESNMYRNMISEAEEQINNYKSMIKNLENLCDAYKTVIDNNTVKVSQANREVAEVVNQLIGRKEF